MPQNDKFLQYSHCHYSTKNVKIKTKGNTAQWRRNPLPPNNRTNEANGIAKFRSHGALNQAVRHGLSAKIRFAKANMKLIFEV